MNKIPTELAVAEEETSRKASQQEVSVEDPSEEEAQKRLKANELKQPGVALHPNLTFPPKNCTAGANNYSPLPEIPKEEQWEVVSIEC